MTATTQQVEVHPYLADLPIFEAEVEAIAESVREVGLLHPVTLDTEGRLIGGRHRLAACERAGVAPEFETYDGDPLTFVLHDNATRKHQTTGQRAAEVALALDSAGKRSDGRWAYGTVVADEMTNVGQSRQRVRDCGLILDHLGRDALVAVALGDRTLNDAYTDAERARDAERNRLEREAREAAEEAEAEAFVTENAPDLVDVVRSSGWSWVAARTEWERRNREAAEELRRAKAAKEKAEREHKAAMTDHFSHQMGTALSTLGGYGSRENPLDVMEGFSPTYLDPPQMERFFTLDNLRAARRFIDALIEWKAAR